jgi:hypothetical protein
MATKRTLQLSHEQVELLVEALDFAYNKRLKLIQEHRDELDKDVIEDILAKGNKFWDLASEIKDGQLDV